MRHFYTGILALLVLTGCRNSLPPAEYAEWISSAENGLQAKHELPQYQLRLQFEPAAFKALQEFTSREENVAFGSLLNQYEGLYHFSLEIESKSQFFDDQEAALINYLENEIISDLVLYKGNDSIGPALVHLERPLGLRPYYYLLLGFSKESAGHKEDIFLRYNGGLLGEDAVFIIKKENLKNIPKLNINPG